MRSASPPTTDARRSLLIDGYTINEQWIEPDPWAWCSCRPLPRSSEQVRRG